MALLKLSYLTLFVSFIIPCSIYSQTEIELKGVLIDSTDFPVPYAAIALLNNKTTGVYSTEDGEFIITITENDYSDTLIISCIGYKKRSLSIKDFLAQKEKKIVLEESITSLDEIELLNPNEYAIRALKNLKKSTISKTHQINALYRVTTAETGKAKRFIEYYIKILDRGPFFSNDFLKYEITERRQSADYRIYKNNKEPIGTFKNLTTFNIIRNPRRFKKSIWKKIGDTSYEGEDIIILQNDKKLKLYVGLNDYGIYRIEGKSSLYVYNKATSGKLHLSYHKREWNTKKNITNPNTITHLKKLGHNSSKLPVSIRYEFIVLDVITDRKKIDPINDYKLTQNNNSFDTTIKSNTGLSRKNNSGFNSNSRHNGNNNFSKKSNISKNKKIDIKYNEAFWNNLKMPPETKFFKKIKKDLESHYGVTFDKQLKLVNK
ncbi:hypothetical protein A8C32_19130 [Flavivirga aquatica]|uniref:Carboxypeptidase-like regulatory domain-containing protein n=1 Tax=Flavivirga aquatica TaxID=1849968 RepID=A0A1E5T439_9FLAO|nr:carboxypeptidase-like regulatory domain-containing protein [Flavivirga aquatica]OEK06145.1 hypothetical protein A8C32_19130 [Flavivirga aquatica]